MCAGQKTGPTRGPGTCILRMITDVTDTAPVGGWDRKKDDIRHRHGDQTCSCHGGEGLWWEFGVSRGQRLHVEWMDHRSYCTAQRTTFNKAITEKNMKKECNIGITKSVCCIAEINTANFKQSKCETKSPGPVASMVNPAQIQGQPLKSRKLWRGDWCTLS